MISARLPRSTQYLASLMVLPLLLLILTGCGGSSLPGSASLQVPELGLSMKVPAGWSADRANPRMCSRGESTGIIIDEPLAGKDFAQHVDILSQEFGARRVLLSPMTVSGRESFEVIAEYPAQGTTALKVYIHKDASLIEVSFVVPSDEFAASEPSLRESVKSIVLK